MSRNSSSDCAPWRFESFLPSSPATSGMCAYTGSSAPSARRMLICFGVFEMWSRPRMTCVMPSSQSSTGEAKLYVGRPSDADEHDVLELLVRRLDAAEHEVVLRRSSPRRACGSGSRPRPRTRGPTSTSRRASSWQRSIRSSWKLSAVPVEPEPRERALDLLGRPLDLAAHVGVLDPQQALAALLAREQPVEQERARGADVEEAGRRRRHANPDGHRAIVQGRAPYRSRVYFGAHVSASGGIHTTLDRAEAMGADAVQLFTQSPRMWRPTNHDPGELRGVQGAPRRARHRARRRRSRTRSTSSTSPRRTTRSTRSRAPRCATRWRSPARSTRTASSSTSARTSAPGSKAGMERCVPALKEVLELCTDTTWLLMEDSAGAGGTIGRSIDELAQLFDACDAARAARHLPRHVPPVRLRRRRHRPRGRRRAARRARRARSASTGCARCTSTTRATRSARTATGTRTSARACSAASSASSSRTRSSRACPRSSRCPAPTSTAPTPKSSRRSAGSTSAGANYRWLILAAGTLASTSLVRGADRDQRDRARAPRGLRAEPRRRSASCSARRTSG